MASMVAAAVPRLSTDAVEILDSELRVIHAAKAGTDEYAASDELADLRRQYDRYFQRKIERILERVVGPGKVVAQVNVKLDHAERLVNQRELDGDKAIVISSRTREATSAGGSAAGVPGTTANIPEVQAPAASGATRESNEADEIANIDVPETRTQTTSLPGQVLSVTASVVVDGVWEVVAAPEGEEAADEEGVKAPEKTYRPRTAEELTEFKAIVASAIGASLEDVTVVNRPFAQLEMSPESSEAALVPSSSAGWIPWAVIGLTILLTFLFVVRPAVLKVTTPLSDDDDLEPLALSDPGMDSRRVTALPGSAHEREQMLSEWLESLAAGDAYVSREDVTRLVSTDLEQSVYTLRSWLNQDV